MLSIDVAGQVGLDVVTVRDSLKEGLDGREGLSGVLASGHPLEDHAQCGEQRQVGIAQLLVESGRGQRQSFSADAEAKAQFTENKPWNQRGNHCCRFSRAAW